jgi:preprotein translocase subunit SecF
MSLRLVSQNINLNFMRFRWGAAILSSIFLLGTIGLLALQGLNFGIDFTGGALVQIQTPEEKAVGTLRQTLKNAGMAGLTIQNYGAGNEFLLRVPLVEGTETADYARQVQTALQPVTGKVEIRRVEFVGPQIGAELREKGLLAILVSLGAILLYITLRFEFRYGLGAIVALTHDVTLTVGMFSLVQKEVTLPVLAALLTIIGYSLNDTIVVFDRIRENRSKQSKRPLTDIMNQSLNQTLARTLMTSITTLLVLAALFLWGGEVIHDFAFTLLFGVIVGTYSSVFVAAPVVLALEGYYQRLAEKMGEEEGETKG